LLLFDDVANDQRKVVYQQRTEILGTQDLSAAVLGMFEEAIGGLLDAHMPIGSSQSDWDFSGFDTAMKRDFGYQLDVRGLLAEQPDLEESVLRERVIKAVLAAYAAKVERIGASVMRYVERDFVLRTLDQQWRDHLGAMDYLRQGIHLRGYAQKDYRYEYKREAFELFTAMLGRVKYESASQVARVEVRTQEEIDREENERRERLMRALQAQHAEFTPALPQSEAAPAEPGGGAIPAGAGPAAGPAAAGVAGFAGSDAPFVRGERKVGRNEPCPCGSGKKYKQCHGVLAEDA
jgi:preprotein translocase subunit SecA